jgi:hypothetical protein
MNRLPLLVLPGLFALAACDSADPDFDTPDPQPDPVQLTVQTAADVPADPVVSNGEGPPASTGRYTFYSLREDRIVLGYDAADRADSASTAWDLAFNGTTVLVNGGTSGPGEGAAQVMERLFDEVTEAPEDGYAADGENAECDTNGLAICGGSGNGWYSYDPATHLITPQPGRTIALRTADGRYAKVRILSYYQGNPATPGADAVSRHYTFEYVFQPDGSRGFTTTTVD